MNHIAQNPNESIDQLLQVILSLKDMDECRAFFSDLCTMQELVLMAQRVQVAKLLMNGETYEKIRSQTSVSSSTITRISTELQYGSGGYRTVLGRLVLNPHRTDTALSPGASAPGVFAYSKSGTISAASSSSSPLRTMASTAWISGHSSLSCSINATFSRTWLNTASPTGERPLP